MDRTIIESPIPISSVAWDWSLSHEPQIQESNEPLVASNFYPERIINSPEYFNQGIDGTLMSIYVRQSVYDKLINAATLLPEGYKFVLFDVWRSNEAQQSLFDILKNKLSKQYPDLSQPALLKRVLTTVAPPSDDIINKPSPHNTGGAVDLAIIDQTGHPLKFGTPFDDHTEVARTSYFEEKLSHGNQLTSDEEMILQNRRLLFNIMTEVGFTNYTDEWWHYDYGNQNWAWKSGAPYAIYGSIRPTFTWQDPLIS